MVVFRLRMFLRSFSAFCSIAPLVRTLQQQQQQQQRRGFVATSLCAIVATTCLGLRDRDCLAL